MGGAIVETLEFGFETTRDLAGGGSHSYDLPLVDGEFVHVVVDQQGVDVAVALYSPSGERILEVDSPIGRRGPEILMAVARASGGYRVEVQAGEEGAPQGAYVLTVRERRAATSEDRDRALAEHHLSEADALRRQGQRESREQAVERYQAARRLFESLQDGDREADTRFRQALVHEGSDEHEAALGQFEAALLRYRSSPTRQREAAFTINQIGRIHHERRESDVAERYFNEALEFARAMQPPEADAAAAALNNLGMLFFRRGEAERALTFFRQALQLHRELRQSRSEARILSNIGKVLSLLGQLEESADHLDQCLRILSTHANPSLEATTLGRRGDVRKRQGRLDEALEDLERSLQLWRGIGRRLREAVRLNSLGTVHLLRGTRLVAEQRYEEAQAIYRELGNQRGEGITLLNLGRIYLPADQWPGDPQRALAYFDRAAPLLENRGDPQAEAANLYGGAMALHDLGRFEEAHQRLEGSLEVVENLRTEARRESLRIAFFASKQHYYELSIDILMHLHEKDRKAGHDVAAFELAERRRARGLLDILGKPAAEMRGFVEPSLLAEELRLQESLNRLGRQRIVLERQGDGEEATLDEALRQVRSDLDAVREQIRGSGSREDRVSVEPRSLEEVRGSLVGSGSILLSYSLGEERSFLWRVSRGGLESHVLPAGREEIEREVEVATELLQARAESADRTRDRALERLGNMLLSPVAGSLGRYRLLIVADGSLHSLPFAALIAPSSEPEEKQPLLKRHEIVYLPSASIALAMRDAIRDREPAPRPILILANPVFSSADDAGKRSPASQTLPEDLKRAASSLRIDSLEALPHTEEEADQIDRLFGGEATKLTGFEASKDRFLRERLDSYQILHFATHGLLNLEHPELSGLVLSLLDERGRERDGFLLLHEIYNLELNAELCVLSACSTGLGQRVRGEGMLGLTRGFMYAGVPRVLVSFWNVSDRGTAELMKRFYWALTEGGAPPATALRAAQLSMLEEESDWSRPFYWAPFILQGEWRLPGQPDDDIEESAAGGGTFDEDDVDLPVPTFCEGLPETWAQKVCAILHRLRSRPMDTQRDSGSAAAAVSPREDDERIFFNGVDGLTGLYTQPPLTEDRIARRVVAGGRDGAEERQLKLGHQQAKRRGPLRRPAPDVDPMSLASSGWGVIFGESTPPDVREALKPLLDHRSEEAASLNDRFYRELEYRAGENKQAFFKRNNVSPGPVHPRQLPYYLLLVGDPEAIPHRASNTSSTCNTPSAGSTSRRPRSTVAMRRA